MPLELQAKLLRVLLQNQFDRVGGIKPVRSDVRVIAATNRDLLQYANSGGFRMDLYYRLNVFPIVIPPLRHRQEGILELVWFFVKGFSERMGKRIDTISNSNLQRLKGYLWPGNIRELKNVIERAMIITSGKTLRIELPKETDTGDSGISTLAEIQTKHILDVMEITNWRVRGKSGAAEILNLKPTTLVDSLI